MKGKNFTIGLIALIYGALTLQAQNTQKPLLQVGEHQYSVDEFNYIYEKNNALSQNPISRDEYIDLFVNYKLKVIEAMNQGYDTVPQFQRELNYYRNELAKPYLTDKKATEAVVAEAYDRLTKEVNASHILVKLPPSPSPEDTLKAYQKIKDIEQQIRNGADFGEMAYEHSDCPSGKRAKGELGYFSGFSMVYPFETAAYNTPVGKVSPIIRTPFGYHLIKVNNIRPNRGEIKVAHIMKAYPYNAPKPIQDQTKVAIDSIYQQLLAGVPFDSLANSLSDDKRTAGQGGELDWFGTGKMIPEFADAAFALEKDDQISEPIQTPFGWHIIKRLDKRDMKSLDEMRPEIEQRIANDERAYAGKSATIKKLKTEYHFTLNQEALKKVTESILATKADADQLASKLEQQNVPLATFAHEQITSRDLQHYISNKNINLASTTPNSIKEVINNCIDETILAYEKSILEDKYPDFRFLMNEYHDGLLIFEISQKEVWNKASEDSTGLKNFFQQHQTDYQLPERYEGTLYFCNNKKTLKKLKKHFAKENVATDSIPEALAAGIKIEKGTFTQGQYPALDAQIWPTAVNKSKKKSNAFVYIRGDKKNAQNQELSDIRGQVISDYQNYLEKKWIENLRKKYKPEINSFVLEQTKL